MRRLVALLAVASLTGSACTVTLGSPEEQTSTDAGAAEVAAKPDVVTDDAASSTAEATGDVAADDGTRRDDAGAGSADGSVVDTDGESAAAPIDSSADSSSTGSSSDSDGSTSASPGSSSGGAETGSVPAWFDPPPGGSVQHEINTDGTYEIIIHSRIGDDSDAAFVSVCNRFEADATAAGWSRVSGDACTDDSFPGATFTDPVTGFEAKVRKRGGDLVLYFLEVGVELTATEITSIAFDRELGLVPPAFDLLPGDQVIALSEGLDETSGGIESYTTSIEVAGPNTFAERCDALVALVGSEPVTGSCDDTSEFAAVGFSYGGGTIVFSEDVYTFIIRNT
ncbi:MAG: hypothetical protein AAF467_08820 [Actinomycetota bacterium]